MIKKEIRILTLAFILLTIIAIISNSYSHYLIDTQNALFNKLYNHPLKVSNTALNIQLNIYKIHRDMKDVVLSPSEMTLKGLIHDVNTNEMIIFNAFDIIKKNILGDKGQALNSEAYTLFRDWKVIRDEVIHLAKQKKYKKAIKITQQKGAKHVLKMDKAVEKLYQYAQNKAQSFNEKSNSIITKQHKISYYVNVLGFVLFISIAYFAISRLNNHMSKNEKLKNALNIRSKELAKIFNESPNPIMVHNVNGTVIKINKSWKALTGYHFEEIDTIEKWAQKAYGAKECEIKRSVDEMYHQNKSLDHGVSTIKTKDDKLLYWKFSSAPLGIINNERVIISSAMDITELKKKDELMVLQSRSAAMGEMISMIAHQWRQPLTTISMIANNTLADIELDILDSKVLKNNSHQLLETTQHLSETINDFRNFFKPDSGKEAILISKVLNDSLKIISSSFKNNDINLNMKVHTEKEVFISSRELMQVFINILNNAKEALTEIKNEEKNILIEVTLENNNIITTIFNNGNNIDNKIISRIFEPYFSTKQKKNGTGLGLYMSKIIVEEHSKGLLEVKNQKDGVAFILTLPILKT